MPDSPTTLLLDATTTIYRKVGPEEGTDAEVTDTDHAGVQVTHVWRGTEHVAKAGDGDGHRLIDVHFFVVDVDMTAAEGWRPALLALLEAWPPDPTYQPENRLEGGPSYLELGAQIGTVMGQQDAMRLMALGQALGLWKVITPESLGMEGAAADRAAGMGYVMITGYRPEDGGKAA